MESSSLTFCLFIYLLLLLPVRVIGSPKCTIEDAATTQWRYLNSSKSCVWVSKFPVEFYNAARSCFLLGSYLISGSDNQVLHEIADQYVNGSNSINIWTSSLKFSFPGSWFQTTNLTYLNITKDSNGYSSFQTFDTSNVTTRTLYACLRPSFASPIGIEENLIENDQFIASSSFQPNQSSVSSALHSPDKVRLNTFFYEGPYYGSGWCSASNKSGEFFEFQASARTIFTGLLIQEGSIRSCRHWVYEFKISLREDVNSNWTSAKSTWSNKDIIYKGVENGNAGSHFVEFNTTFIAIGIRIHPLRSGCSCAGVCDTTFCMRLELYGRTENDKHLIKYAGAERTFGLPKHLGGCSKLSISSHLIFSNANVTLLKSNSSSLTIDSDEDITKQGICIQSAILPAGRYCVFKTHDLCPVGFASSTLQVSDYWFGHFSAKSRYNGINGVQDDLYCCRNDNETESMQPFPMTKAFYLLPLNATCPNVTMVQQTVEYINFTLISQTVDSIVTSKLHPFYKISNGSSNETIISFLYCLYTPILTPTDMQVFGAQQNMTLRSNQDFQFTVSMFVGDQVWSHGPELNQSISLLIIGLDCPVTKWEFPLNNGTAVVQGHSCHEQSQAIISISFFSTTVLTKNFSVNFVKEVKVAFLINSDVDVSYNFSLESVRNKFNLNNDIHIVTLSMNASSDLVNQLQQLASFDSKDTNRIDLIFAIEPNNNFETIASFSAYFDVPTLIYSSKKEILENSYVNIAFLSSPFTDALSTAILKFSFEIQEGTSDTDPSEVSRGDGRDIQVIIFREVQSKISYNELFAMNLLNVTILADIVFGVEKEPWNQYKTYGELIKSLPSAFIIIDLYSIHASNLFKVAGLMSVAPIDGRKWLSLSPYTTVSNAFVSPVCRNSKPLCHEAFVGLMNLMNIQKSCPSNAPASVSNLKEYAQEQIRKRAVEELLHFGFHHITEIRSSNQSLRESYLDEVTSSTYCLPTQGQTGLKFLQQSSSLSSIKTMKCQIGWHGELCDQLYCSSSECNPYRGKCIAPKTCHCQPGWYGRACYGDCRHTCQNGVCSDGASGTGKCLSCDWLYTGEYCDSIHVLYGLVFAVIGVIVTVLYIVGLTIKYFQKREQQAEAVAEEMEHEETHLKMKWEDFESVEQVEYQSAVVKRYLSKKFNYCKYYKATTFTGKTVFVKSMKKPNFQLTLNMKNEIKNIYRLDHVNIEKMLALIMEPPYVGIVTEATGMGSLFDVLNKKYIPITWDVKYSMMQDICRGMEYLHDSVNIIHGRLKSTNCLIHHGWLLKISDIGLGKVRSKDTKGEKSGPAEQTATVTGKQRLSTASWGHNRSLVDMRLESSLQRKSKKTSPEEDTSDYQSLLWTAPEFLTPQVKSIDNVKDKTAQGDAYSFGIILAEILSRRPPFGEISVMPIAHIVQAVGHVREVVQDLGAINLATKTTRKQSTAPDKEESSFRPHVDEYMFPKDESEKSILRVLMESCWHESPEERPPFSYTLNVLELISPLKGTPTSKRLKLLQQETESLEQYIGYDTHQLFQEKDKLVDFLKRMLPGPIPFLTLAEEKTEPINLDSISILVCRIQNMDDIVRSCNPVQVIAVIDFVWKAFDIIISNRKLSVMEIFSKGDEYMFGASRHISNCERHQQHLAILATRVLVASRSFKLSFNPNVRIVLRMGLNTGPGVVGVARRADIPCFMVNGEAVSIARMLEEESPPGCLHVSRKTAVALSQVEFDMIGRMNYKMRVGKMTYKTYLVTERA